MMSGAMDSRNLEPSPVSSDAENASSSAFISWARFMPSNVLPDRGAFARGYLVRQTRDDPDLAGIARAAVAASCRGFPMPCRLREGDADQDQKGHLDMNKSVI